MKSRSIGAIVVIGLVLITTLVYATGKHMAKENLIRQYQRFSDESKIASMTGRALLGNSIRELNDIRRETEDIAVPFWYQDEKTVLIFVMGTYIDGYSLFQDTDTEQEAIERIIMADSQSRSFERMVGLVD